MTPLTPERAQKLRDLAVADAQVMMGRPLTEGERRVAAHTMETAINIIGGFEELAAKAG